MRSGSQGHKGGLAAGEIDLLKTGLSKGFDHCKAGLTPKMTLGQDLWLDILEGCEAEPAFHIAGLPQVVIDGRYVGREAHAVPLIQGCCAIGTPKVAGAHKGAEPQFDGQNSCLDAEFGVGWGKP